MNKISIPVSLAVPILSLALLCACTSGKEVSVSVSPTAAAPSQTPTVTTPVWSPADASLAEYKAYTFSTQGADLNAVGSISRYTWDFGDGTPVQKEAGSSVTHAFTGAGPFTVQVTATDSQQETGAAAKAAVTVVEALDPFTVNVVSPTQATTQNTHAGDPVTLVYEVRASALNGEVLSPSELLLNPGDPTAILGEGRSDGGGLYYLPVTYLAPPSGSRVLNATVQVQDYAGNLGPAVTIPPYTLDIVTADTPPVVTLAASAALSQGPDTSYPGSTITFNATATDADFDPLTYSWSFGDSLGAVTATSDPGALTQTHTFKTAGTYTVTFSADDGWPGGKTSTTLTMDILPDSPPVLAVSYAPAAPLYANVPVTFTATATDPSDNTLSYAWSVNGQQQGSAPTFTWTFLSGGTPTVQLQVADRLGQSATWSATPTVLANQGPVTTLSDDPTVPLLQYVPHTFTAVATDPDAGDTIASYQWAVNYNAPVTTTGPTYTFIPPDSTSAMPVQVRAVDNHGAVGAYTTVEDFQVLQENQPSINPNQSLPNNAQVAVGGQWSATGTFTVTESPVGGNPPFLPFQTPKLNAGDPNGSGQVTMNPDGSYTFTLTYQAAAAPGARTLQPTLTVQDANGVPSNVTSLGTCTLTTVAALAPIVVNYTNPGSSPVTSSLVTVNDLEVTLVNPSGNATTVTVAWGDGTAPATDLFSNGLVPGQTQYWYPSHLYAQFGTFQVQITAADGQGTATAPPLTYLIPVDAYPTTTIVTPTASANLPPSGTFPAGGPVLPPGPQDPEVLVVPLKATVQFSGTFTPPTVGSYTVSWSAPGATLLSQSGQNQEQTIQFPGTSGQMTPYLVTFSVVDQFGRSSSDPASGNAPRAYSKWVVVDGKNSQVLTLNCLYRQMSDQTGQGSLTPATQPSDGLGALVTLYQDGVAQVYPVQNAAGTQATVALPMRSDLPAYLELPPILPSDARTFVMTIPKAKDLMDPLLAQPSGAGSSFYLQSTTPPWNPTLNLVLAQGFGPESGAPARKQIQGALSSQAMADFGTSGWLDRLTAVSAQEPNGAPTLEALNPLPDPLACNGNQGFAEWPMLLAASSLPGFNLNYEVFAEANNPSQSGTVDAWQAFRIPGSTVASYDPGSITNGWNNPSCLTTLTPAALPSTVPTFWQNAFYGDPNTGGLQDFLVPYDPNDPNRTLIAPVQRPFLPGAAATMGYAEYLWSSVWARPLVLNSADLDAGDAAQGALASCKAFNTATAAAWPQLATSIPPDQSTFTLTPAGGASFLGGSPVGFNGAPAPAGGVGRFFWTAFTPAYGVNGGALVTRTWLADATTNQPPITPSVSDNPTLLGFLPPQDVNLDLRGRDLLTGQLTGEATGGYRILWFNPTVDSSGGVVAPDFWVVALDSLSTGLHQHFLVPAGYPAGKSPSLSGPVLTDAPAYLPSGNASPGPADQVAPGYCWFDVPAPFRHALDPGETLNLTVFGVRSILTNAPPAMARSLAFPDWVDAIRLNTAGATVIVDGDGLVNLSDAYGVPFQFPWDIVMANGTVATVAQ